MAPWGLFSPCLLLKGRKSSVGGSRRAERRNKVGVCVCMHEKEKAKNPTYSNFSAAVKGHTTTQYQLPSIQLEYLITFYIYIYQHFEENCGEAKHTEILEIFLHFYNPRAESSEHGFRSNLRRKKSYNQDASLRWISHLRKSKVRRKPLSFLSTCSDSPPFYFKRPVSLPNSLFTSSSSLLAFTAVYVPRYQAACLSVCLSLCRKPFLEQYTLSQTPH